MDRTTLMSYWYLKFHLSKAKCFYHPPQNLFSKYWDSDNGIIIYLDFRERSFRVTLCFSSLTPRSLHSIQVILPQEALFRLPVEPYSKTRPTPLLPSLFIAIPSRWLLSAPHTAFTSILLLQWLLLSPNEITSLSLLKPFPVRLGQHFPIRLVIRGSGVVFNNLRLPGSMALLTHWSGLRSQLFWGSASLGTPCSWILACRMENTLLGLAASP